MNHQVRSGREAALVFNLINTSLPRESGLFACISSRITTVIQVVREYNQINDNWFNEPFAVSQYKCLYLDMHGLIFETSIWYWQDQPVNYSQLSETERSSVQTPSRPSFVLFPSNPSSSRCHVFNDMTYRLLHHSMNSSSYTEHLCSAQDANDGILPYCIHAILIFHAYCLQSRFLTTLVYIIACQHPNDLRPKCIMGYMENFSAWPIAPWQKTKII